MKKQHFIQKNFIRHGNEDLLSPVGALIMLADMIHRGDMSKSSKEKAIFVIDAMMEAAAAKGYTRALEFRQSLVNNLGGFKHQKSLCDGVVRAIDREFTIILEKAFQTYRLQTHLVPRRPK